MKALVPLPCMCATLRRTSRALSQFYEQALRSEGIRVSQFTILQVLARVGEVSQGNLGEILAMDSTTLSRALAIMRRERWISERRGEDRRERHFRLTETGNALLKRATPPWEQAQSEVRRRLGKQAWESLQQLANQTAESVTTEKETL